MKDKVELRDAPPGDSGFLFDLYCDTRAEELNCWGWTPEQQEAFLRMQFDARQGGYATT